MYILALETAVMWLVLNAIQWLLRKNPHRIARSVVFILKVLLIPGVALLFVAAEWPLAYTHGDILLAFYIALIGDVVASAVEYIIRRVREENSAQPKACYRRLIAILSAVISALVLVYGVYNFQHVAKNTHEWQADGLKSSHTFAFLSDIHVGPAQSAEALREVCQQINAENPEFVIIGGDVTDELCSYENMQGAYDALSTLQAPVYFVYGNHDRQPGANYVGGSTYTHEQLTQAIRGAGISILSDEYLKVADDLVLLGREDMSMAGVRKNLQDLKNPYEGQGALIIADHQPYDNNQLATGKAALQLSGHTHAGQLWPLNSFYRMLWLQTYGEFLYPNLRLYVSAGEAGWMVPFRTEQRCEWDLITLHP